MTDDGIEMFGCTTAEAKQSINETARFYFGDANMALGAILSDVQELISGQPSAESLEAARQYLNKVKMALFRGSQIVLWERED